MRQIVFDSEYNDLNPKKVTKVWCIVAYDLNECTLHRFTPDSIEAGLDFLFHSEYIIGQNIISADLRVFKHLMNWDPNPKSTVIDLLLMSRLFNPDRPRPWGMSGKAGPHSVEAWGYRFGRPKPVHDEWDKYSEEMLYRCEQDTIIQVQMYRELYKEATK